MSSTAPADQATEEGKKVSWAELFFDLVFVVAVTQVAALLEHDHTPGGAFRALVVFVPVYWVWVGMSVQTNLVDVSSAIQHVRIFAVALAGVFMALTLPSAYEGDGVLFACAYWAGRLVLATNVVGRLLRREPVPPNPYLVSVVLTGPLLVIGAVLHGDAQVIVWAIAALLDLSTPTVLRRRMSSMHFDAGHLAERFGLFVLIALGESVVSVTIVSHDVDVPVGSAVAAAFVLSCGLWWVYFHFAADAVRHALATARVQLDITRLVLSYGHLAFIAAIILVSVGMHDAIEEPTHELSWPVSVLLVGGVALYLATFGFTRWAMFRLVSYSRLSAAVVVLVLLSVAPNVPALVTLILLAVVLVALNVVEAAMVSQIGWRALTNARAGDERRA